MPRSAITLCKMAAFNTFYTATEDALDVANDHEIDMSDTKAEKVAFIFDITTAPSAITVKFKAGSEYEDSALGDLSLTIASAITRVVTIETSRFKDASEMVYIDISTTQSATVVFAGTITAIELPYANH